MTYLCDNNLSDTAHILWASSKSPGLTFRLVPQLLDWRQGVGSGGRIGAGLMLAPVLCLALPLLLIP